MNIKRKLGQIRRAAIGVIDNFCERPPIIDNMKSSIGTSLSGMPIGYVKIGSGAKKILFAAGMHGNEVGTVKLAFELIEWLKKRGDLQRRFTFFIVPCLNPDGYEQARRHPDYLKGGVVGRFNARNVDLNRNFKTPTFQSRAQWTRGRNYEEKVDVFSGETANSEPEVKALIKLVKSEKPLLIISFHNAGADVTSNTIKPAPALADIYSDVSGYRRESNEEWMRADRTGTLKEWCEINEFAFLEIEGRSRWSSDWSNQKTAIEKILDYLIGHSSGSIGTTS